MAAASVSDDWLPDDDKGESRLEVNASITSEAKNIAFRERKERRWNKRLNLRLASYTILPIATELDVWTGHALEECDDQRSKNYQALERHHPRVFSSTLLHQGTNQDL
jgi:hypothetical protein